jgi:hypothetical protein
MACITPKSSGRHRIQFTMGRELHEIYQKNMDLAQKLGVSISFGQDFEEWFGDQMAKVKHELDELQVHRSVSVKPKTVEEVSCNTAPSTVADNLSSIDPNGVA